MKINILSALSLFFIVIIFSCVGSDNKSNSNQVAESSINKKNGIIAETETNENKEVDEQYSEEVVEGNGDKVYDQDEVKVTPEQIAKADELIASVKDSDIEKVDVNKLYRMHCALCHGFKGNMKINGAKDLTISDIPLNESVAQVYHGKGLMTPYKGILKDAEIVALSKYIETLRKKG